MIAVSCDQQALRRSRLARMVRGLVLTVSAVSIALSVVATSALAQGSSPVIKGRDGWLFPGWGSLSQIDRNGIENSTRLIAQARELLASRGIALNVLVIPDKVRLYPGKLPEGTSMSADVQGRYARIMEALNKAGVPTFDDAVVLKDALGKGADVFYRTDQHWTLPAVEATAKATAEMVRKSVAKLDGASGTGMALGPLFKERRYGDLADLFLTPDEREKLGRDIYTVRRQPEAAQLVDETEAPVHIVGHSMVQPYYGFPQKLSNDLDRPVSLNWKPGNIGPWAVMLEYLESSEFRKHKPQVIVWQMFEPTFSYGPDAVGWWDGASLMPPQVWLDRVRAALGT